MGITRSEDSSIKESVDGIIGLNKNTVIARATDYKNEVALGKWGNRQTWNKWGYNPDIDTATETVWSVGGTFTPLTTASTLQIVSTSAQDAPDPATGARSIIIYGIDENREEQIEVVQMDGLATVTTTTTWLGINRMSIYLSGSGGVNAGTITATATTGGSIQGQIPVGTGTTQQAIFFTEVGKTALMSWLLLNIVKDSGGASSKTTIKLWVRSFVSGSKYEVFRHIIDSGVENSIELRPAEPFVVGERSVIYVEATTTANNVAVSARFSLIEQDS